MDQAIAGELAAPLALPAGVAVIEGVVGVLMTAGEGVVGVVMTVGEVLQEVGVGMTEGEVLPEVGVGIEEEGEALCQEPPEFRKAEGVGAKVVVHTKFKIMYSQQGK